MPIKAQQQRDLVVYSRPLDVEKSWGGTGLLIRLCPDASQHWEAMNGRRRGGEREEVRSVAEGWRQRQRRQRMERVEPYSYLSCP